MNQVSSWLVEDGALAAPPYIHDSPVVYMCTRSVFFTHVGAIFLALEPLAW